MRIGIDLDNTIIFYDDAFITAATERGLLPSGFKGTKQQLRDAIRKLEGGETEWQKLQGYVYGKGLAHASFFDGLDEFLTSCKGCDLHIVSHKTEFGHYDPERINLRDAAKAWLRARGFFNHMKESNLVFAGSRKEKIKAIASLKPHWFIDDLVEVYEEPGFPQATRKILFHSAPTPPPAGDWAVCRSWREIRQKVFA